MRARYGSRMGACPDEYRPSTESLADMFRNDDYCMSWTSHAGIRVVSGERIEKSCKSGASSRGCKRERSGVTMLSAVWWWKCTLVMVR